MTLAEQVKREARRLGFSAVGIARVDASTPGPGPGPGPGQPGAASPGQSLPALLHARLSEWLERGYHGSMQWLARDPERRSDPRRLLPDCRTVISLGLNYYTERDADERPGHGRIARYAWGDDYHRVLRDRLAVLAAFLHARRPDARTKVYVDTGPVMEKAWAQQAGLGWIGKHSHLVSADYGSWLLLGEILTTLDLDPDEPATDLCGSCSRCIQACPTGAIPEPYVLDARRCLSYLTIELRHGEEIPADLAAKMGNRIFGCDDCLDACPYNLQAVPTAEPAFQPRPTTVAPVLEDLARCTEAEFLARFRHSPVSRPRFNGFMRNVRIALRNLLGSKAPDPLHHPR